MTQTQNSDNVQGKDNKLLDIFKFIAAILILASHCLPLIPNENFNFFYGQWFFRFCVPLFLISSGFFFASFNRSRKIKYIKRIAILYFFSTLLYMPIYLRQGPSVIIRNSLLGYHHLWYLSALLISLIFCFFLEETFCGRLFNKLYPLLIIPLILIGAFFDEYQYVFTELKDMHFVAFIRYIIRMIGGHRHALFFAFPEILIGKFLYDHKRKINPSSITCVVLTALSLLLSLAECFMLRYFGGNLITCDITLFNYLPAVFLFLLTLSSRPKGLSAINTRTIRKISDIVYISHVLVILIIDQLLGVTYITRLVLVILLSVCTACVYVKIERIIIKRCQTRNYL